MSGIEFLWLANTLVWIGISGYIFFLARQKNKLGQRLQSLEKRISDRSE